jgi:enoyl-CoA hydratase
MTVSFDLQDDIAIIGLDDGKKNVVNHDVLDELELAFDRCDSNGAKAVLFKGREGSFCAGYDINVMTGGDPQASIRLGRRGGRLARRIYGSNIPIVGLCQGHAFTIGAVWLACCDLAVAEPGNYKFGMTEVALDVPLTGWALDPLMAKLNPQYRTAALMHSTIYTPEGALEAGFIDKLLPAGEALATAIATTERLAKLPSNGYVKTKLAMRGELLTLMDTELA